VVRQPEVTRVAIRGIGRKMDLFQPGRFAGYSGLAQEWPLEI
jgi:hypothetical protein